MALYAFLLSVIFASSFQLSATREKRDITLVNVDVNVDVVNIDLNKPPSNSIDSKKDVYGDAAFRPFRPEPAIFSQPLSTTNALPSSTAESELVEDDRFLPHPVHHIISLRVLVWFFYAAVCAVVLVFVVLAGNKRRSVVSKSKPVDERTIIVMETPTKMVSYGAV
uniref:Transmembrane protein n=1 Tax=Plectus sambesii TaxID=2011161 RepID=A0A914W546_9BILA